MGLAVIHTRALEGVKAIPVEVEVLTSNGLPGISIVGLPEAAVRESKDRVRGALKSSGFKLPQQRITINLAPADLPKEGGRYDLPIAIGILLASNQLRAETDHVEFLGELSLSGDLRATRGVLPAAISSTAIGRAVLVPAQNTKEASLASDSVIIGANTLLDVCAHLSGLKIIKPAEYTDSANEVTYPDMTDIKGQDKAKRALVIAASGGHNILFVGPPGTGKTMLAGRLPGIMPPLTESQAIETATVYSISDDSFSSKNWRQRPYRAPHHSSSAPALVGGGSVPKPGEISLAHNGVLFLDELPEFDRKVLEVLREPMESGRVLISRAVSQAEFPADFLFIGACNPCPCGYFGDESGRCRCTPEQIRRYRNKISGPLLDRIDMHVEVPRVPMSALQDNKISGSTSEQIRQTVKKARELQLKRQGKENSLLSGKELEHVCLLSEDEQDLLRSAMGRLNLSARAYHRVLRLSRTIADLASEGAVRRDHIAEAISYRILDRER